MENLDSALDRAGADGALIDRARRTSPAGRGDHTDAPIRAGVALLAELLAEEIAAPRDGVAGSGTRRARSTKSARPTALGSRVRDRFAGRREQRVVTGVPLAAAATAATAGLAVAPVHPATGTRAPDEAFVLAADPARAMAEVWAARMRAGGARSWVEFVDAWEERGRLAYRADVSRTAAAWQRLGADVHVVLDHRPIAGRPVVRPVRPEPVFAAYRLLLRLNPVLRIFLDEPGQAAARALVLPTVDASAGPLPPILRRHRDLMEREARRSSEAVAVGGYALHGDPALLAASGAAPDGSSWDNDPVLEVCARAILALPNVNLTGHTDHVKEGR